MSDPGFGAACAAAYAACPALRGVQPRLERKGDRRVFVFSAAAPGPGRGPRFVVRVTVDSAGQVLRVTTAR